MTLDRARIMLFAVLTILLVGYLGLRPLAATIDDRYVQLARLQAALRQHVDLERRRRELTDEARALRAELAPFHLAESRAQLVARFLAIAEASATSDDVRIENVLAAAQAPTASAPGAATALEPVPLDLTVSGAYGNVLRLTRGWDGRGLALGVAIRSMIAQRAGGSSSEPRLSAVLHVTVLREHDAQSTPSAHR